MHLNYLPLRFTSDVFRGGILSFDSTLKEFAAKKGAFSQKLRELRREHGSSHVFHAMGNAIACIGLTPDAPLIGEERQFDILTDFQLANALARSALFHFFTSAGNETVVGFRPVALGPPENKRLTESAKIQKKLGVALG